MLHKQDRNKLEKGMDTKTAGGIIRLTRTDKESVKVITQH